MAKVKKDAANLRVPQSRTEAEAFIAKIGNQQRERDRIQANMNDELAAIKQKYEELAQPIATDIRLLTDGVQIWCEANRATLTNQNKTKTAKLASGEVKWRTRPGKVSLKKIAEVIETLKTLKLKRFIRIEDSINKEAILAEPEVVENIKGITITKGEDFVIVPFETELEEVA